MAETAPKTTPYTSITGETHGWCVWDSLLSSSSLKQWALALINERSSRISYSNTSTLCSMPSRACWWWWWMVINSVCRLGCVATWAPDQPSSLWNGHFWLKSWIHPLGTWSCNPFGHMASLALLPKYIFNSAQMVNMQYKMCMPFVEEWLVWELCKDHCRSFDSEVNQLPVTCANQEWSPFSSLGIDIQWLYSWGRIWFE